MLTTYKLLNEYVDLDGITPEELVDKLTFSGFEVEGTHPVAQASKLIVGKVVSCQMHPDSDHLHLLKVDCGQEGVLDIVCGAPNVRKDLKVIVALVGCELPSIGLTIKANVIRGAKSNGMCCSLVELGVDKAILPEEEVNGIHELPDDAPVGEREVLNYLGLDDVVIDINVLANRPDCLSVIGLAREISALFGRKMKEPPEFDLKVGKTDFQVLSKTDSCDVFNLMEVDNLNNGKTPAKIVRYLNSVGIRSISLIVDLGNFSMILTGQPLHMYDLDKLASRKLVVNDAFEGKVIALDEKEYDVIKGDVVISDEKKPCCIGGVMGLKNVEVDENTKHIGIEAAHFYHAAIRHTATRLNLNSDSSALFIKGTNPYTTLETLQVTADLIKKVVPNAKIVGTSTFSKVEKPKESYPFSFEKLNSHLGTNFSDEEILNMLKMFNVKYENGRAFFNRHRLDLKEQCDLEEEMFRTSSPDRVIRSLESLPHTKGGLTELQAKEMRIKNLLLDAGFDQILSYTLISKEKDRYLRVFDENPSLKVSHPMTEDHEYIRSDIFSSMVDTLKYNIQRKHSDLKLFEISSVSLSVDKVETYLSLGLSGQVREQGLLSTHKADFYDIKGAVELIFDALGIDSRRYKLVKCTNSIFHPGRSASLFIGKKLIGSFGELNPKLGEGELIVGELNLTQIVSLRTSQLKAEPISSIQPVTRDLAFNILDDSVTSQNIADAIKRAGGKYVRKVEIFDVFEKDGKKSLAFKLTIQNTEEKSLTDEKIQSLINTILLNVTHKLKVELK
ncbi:MAG: phenylalanine--tRNA ligase subunit beta [Bacilli bacterium]